MLSFACTCIYDIYFYMAWARTSHKMMYLSFGCDRTPIVNPACLTTSGHSLPMGLL